MKIKPIKIGKRLVGQGYPCYIIAEIGSNFDGSLTKAKKLIKTAKQCGADAAKFQSFLTEELLSKNGFNKKSAFQSRWKKSVWQTYKDAELPREWHNELGMYAKKIGIDFFTSPWDFQAVDLLENLNVPAFKVGSGDITFLKLLKYIASKGKPVLLATGASNMKEVSKAIDSIRSVGNNHIVLMHAVVQYPSPPEDTNLLVLPIMQNKFKLNIGYSDHSPGSAMALAAVSMGCSVIEKHFTLNPKSKGPDHPHSMDPKSFREMIKNIRIIENGMGDGIKKAEKSETETRIIQRRGIWTITKIKKGEPFTDNNIKALRPVIGIPASKYDSLLGRKAKRNFHSYEPILTKDI